MDVSWLAFGTGGEPENSVREKADAREIGASCDVTTMLFPTGSRVQVRALPDGTVEVKIDREDRPRKR